jgi:hypothetical protein
VKANQAIGKDNLPTARPLKPFHIEYEVIAE